MKVCVALRRGASMGEAGVALRPWRLCVSLFRCFLLARGPRSGLILGAFMSGRLGCVGAVAAAVCGLKSVAATVYHREPVYSGLSCRNVGLQGLAV